MQQSSFFQLTEAERDIVFRALGSWFNLKAMEGASKEECHPKRNTKFKCAVLAAGALPD
jgi:hypothetical protein